MTHGHELRGGMQDGRIPDGRGQRGKNWDNCNSIINKYTLKKENDEIHGQTFMFKLG